MPLTYSLVAPIFNEEAVIPVLLKRLDALLEAFEAPAEVILVDDGSRDSSAIVMEARARADKRNWLIDCRAIFGHQIAINVGLDHAAGRAVIVMDADLQDPTEVVLEMIAKWKGGLRRRLRRARLPSGRKPVQAGDRESLLSRHGAARRCLHTTQRRRFPPGGSPGAPTAARRPAATLS
jgi:glycosyltransferase involved in cell wall biosynthesis